MYGYWLCVEIRVWILVVCRDTCMDIGCMEISVCILVVWG